MEPLHTLHEVLQDAGYQEMMFQSSSEYQYEGCRQVTRKPYVQSFQLEQLLKEQLDVICRSNGTTASAFLRECCRRLVSEYEAIEIGTPRWIRRFGESVKDGVYSERKAKE
jgi:predicted DNA-binding protein